MLHASPLDQLPALGTDGFQEYWCSRVSVRIRYVGLDVTGKSLYLELALLEGCSPSKCRVE